MDQAAILRHHISEVAQNVDLLWFYSWNKTSENGDIVCNIVSYIQVRLDLKHRAFNSS